MLLSTLTVSMIGKAEQNMKIMGIDYGDSRTGIAVSDLLCSIVGTTKVIHSRNMDKTVDAVCELLKNSDVGEIVVGLPKNMDGTEGARADLYRAFAAKLEELTGLKPVLWDERRTTIDAHRILSENGKKMKKHRENVDAVAAGLILEGYLQFRSNRG